MKTIGLIALSGGVNKEKLNAAVTNLGNLGFNVKLSKNILSQNRYLAGSDEDKLEDLYTFFQDPEIDIVMAIRGGYGAIRLINKIDYSIIKNNPKIFCGYSDVTALLLMIYKKTGMVTYHGLMGIDFTEIDITSHIQREIEERTPTLVIGVNGLGEGSSLDCFKKTINNEILKFDGKKCYKEGFANGIIWGGNLSTVVSLCGQDFIPNKDFIFFAEDLNEPVYKIDRMFQQLINIPEFGCKCRGIVLGDFLDVDNEAWLEEYFYELAEELQIPIIGGFKITHNQDKITLPIGKMAFIQEQVLKIE